MTHPAADTFIPLINQHLGIAHKVCRIYFADAADYEDVLQEMLYQLWRSYPAFDQRAKFSTWMYSVCLNTALTYRRKQQKHKSEALSFTHQQIAAPAAENKNEVISLLFEAIATLSPVNKAIVLLYLEDMSYEEIADITGLTRSNVSVRLVRLKRELETILKQKIKSIDNVNL
ncbi:MAG TPA: sigma-70 family RNA polymerase sigma factor [Flavisolibacter sp.]|nr:sigma-70 family RNA polymerase sigma factor [Flavisolibacter sp.]